MSDHIENLPPKEKRSGFNRFLDRTETIGNRLPHPTILFMVLAVIMLILSWVGATLGWTVKHPSTGEDLVVFNLLSQPGIEYIFQNFISNVTSFAPLGVMLVVMMGMGVLEDSGLLKACFVNIGAKVNRHALTTVIVLLGILANFMSDTGIIVLPPLTAMLFAAVGRSPLVGMCCAYAAATAGMAANLLITVGDATITSITVAAAQIIDPDFSMNPTCCWYFFAGAVLVLTPVAVLVTERILEPRMGKWEGSPTAPKLDLEQYYMSPQESKAMKGAGLLVLLVIALLVLGVVFGILRDETGAPLFLAKKNSLSSIILAITILMGVPGIYYGKKTGVFKDTKDLGKSFTKAIVTVAPFIAICVFAAQFIAYFGKTNLGLMLAVVGAEGIKNSGMPTLLLFVIAIVLFALINLFVASSAAKWTVLAPVFIPMCMLLNLNPSIMQAAYRVGDTFTNCVTPMLAYFVMLLGLAKQYDEKAGMGTVMSMMVPYSIFYAITWIIYFSVYFLLGLPFGF